MVHLEVFSCHVCLLTLFRSLGQWNKFDLDRILGKGDQLFKSLCKYRYLGIEDLSQEFLIE